MSSCTNVTRLVVSISFCLALCAGCSEDSVAPDPEDVQDDPCAGNHAPIVESILDRSVAVGDTVRLQAFADDPDGDGIRFSCACTNLSWTEIVAGWHPAASIDSESGEFRFIVASTDVPRRTFVISAADSCGAVGGAGFAINVSQ